MAERGREVLKVVDQAESTQSQSSKSDDWLNLKPRLCYLRHVIRLIRLRMSFEADQSTL
jgi:hypothetical protein